MPTTTNNLISSLLLGTATGLRSTSGPLAVALAGPPALGAQPLAALSSARGRRIAAFNALGEVGADKLPFVPPRTQPGPLAGRVAFGALAGFAGAQRSGGSRLVAAATAAAAAGAASFAGTAWRGYAAKRFGADWQGALIEDAACAGIAALGARSLR